MIDLGLAKLAMIGAVALIVIGPEKLPKVARMAGTLFGRAQRYINQVKAEVSREIELDELRKMQSELQDTAADLHHSVKQQMHEVEQEVNSIWPGNNAYPSAQAVPDPSQLARKAKEFRRKKLARSSALPAWYKQQHGNKTQLLSGAARVAKYRPGKKSARSFF